MIEWFDRSCLASIFEIPYGAGLKICPDAKTLFLLKVTNIEIIENYVISILSKNTKRCQLCCEKSSKKFKECGQCSMQFCHSCFKKANENCLSCPFCRYTLLNHIEKYITKLSMEKQNKLIRNLTDLSP